MGYRRIEYFIACQVNDDFNFIGVWCHGADQPNFQYIGQFWKYLQIHKSHLSKCMIAGDFNSNVIWDKQSRTWNHSDVVRELKDLKIESLYHKYFKEQEGKESQPTFCLQKKLSKPYHIDYIFASQEFSNTIKRMTIGLPKKWMEVSDHMPVFCEF